MNARRLSGLVQSAAKGVWADGLPAIVLNQVRPDLVALPGDHSFNDLAQFACDLDCTLGARFVLSDPRHIVANV